MLGMLRMNMGSVNFKNESNPICYIDFRYCFLDYIHVYVKVRNVRNVKNEYGECFFFTETVRNYIKKVAEPSKDTSPKQECQTSRPITVELHNRDYKCLILCKIKAFKGKRQQERLKQE